MTPVTISQARSMLAKLVQLRLVPMIHGSPGLGKSAIVNSFSQEYGLKLIDLRLAACDPTDLNGFPFMSNGRGSYLPMDTFPVEGDTIPQGFTGWALFLDEVNGGSLDVLKAAYKLILDRMVGQHKLHPNVVIICAGNLDTDGAIVNEMGTALRSRMVHIQMAVSMKDFLTHAREEHFDPRITSYLGFKPDHLYTLTEDFTDFTFACPRTWDFANKILKNNDILDPDTLPMLSGALSEGVGREFVAFCKIEADLPKMAQIINNPSTIQMPQETSILWALTGTIGSQMNPTNVGPLVTYVKRMPKEFQVITLRESIRRNKPMLSNPVIQDWVAESSMQLFD